MRVIATAGHVDHGKSTLVKALTSMVADRLREEQAREMTIDLGFAWMTLPGAGTDDAETVGVIDVPGHIDFIENMLAGVGGIDAALLVIAADEGPMPQTREHLAILDLLRVSRAVVALTKTDLAPDADWVELVKAEVAGLLAGTHMAGAPIVPVSARKGEGLDALKRQLQTTLGSASPRRNVNKPRLPIDRVFSVAGFGTVVTGTLIDGDFAVGDEVEIAPLGIASRVRGLQTHQQAVSRAVAGSRVAINVANVAVGELRRGHVVAKPGSARATTMFDARLESLDPSWQGRSAPRALRHNMQLKVFTGAAEAVATLRVLDDDEIAPGRSGWAQLVLDEAIACANGDRFIARLPSPSVTVGGGVIVDVAPRFRHRRRAGRADDETLAHLESLLSGSPEERALNALRQRRFATPAELAQAIGMDDVANVNDLLAALTADELVAFSQGVVALSETWRALRDEAARLLAAFHAAQPLAEGMPRDTLRSKLELGPRDFNALLANSQSASAPSAIRDDGDTVRLSAHEVRFSPRQQAAADALLRAMAAAPFATPLVKVCRAQVGDDVYDVLVRRGELVQVSDEVVFTRAAYDDATQRIRAMLARDGQITAAQVRDALGASRKYALGLLEHLDRVGVTRRVGDARVLR